MRFVSASLHIVRTAGKNKATITLLEYKVLILKKNFFFEVWFSLAHHLICQHIRHGGEHGMHLGHGLVAVRTDELHTT